MRSLPTSLQVKMAVRNGFAYYAYYADLNGPDATRAAFRDQVVLDVPSPFKSYPSNRTVWDRLGQRFEEFLVSPKKIASSFDTIVEGLSATGIPVLSQVAGVTGIVWGVGKGLGRVLMGINAEPDQVFPRLGWSALKSIVLGASTFFPPVGVPANAVSAGLSGFNASIYHLVEPLTRASKKDIPELMAMLSKNPNDERLKILLGSIGTSIVPAIKTVQEDNDKSDEFKSSLLSVLYYNLRLKRGESPSDLSPLVRFLLLETPMYSSYSYALGSYYRSSDNAGKKIFENAVKELVNDSDPEVQAAARAFLQDFQEEAA